MNFLLLEGWSRTFALGAATGCCLAAAAAPKIVASGWDIGRMSPARIVASADKFADAPFDGIVFNLNLRDDIKDERDGFLRASCGRIWPRETLKPFIETFRKASEIDHLRSSFVGSMFAPMKRMGWRDDKTWAAFAANLKTLAWLAKEGRLKGLVLDTEDYWRASQFEMIPSDGASYDEMAALARRRGRELFSGVFEEFPDIRIVTYWWFSFHHEYVASPDPLAAARGIGDLMPALTDGMLDVMPPTARLLDGNEHTYHWLFDRSCVAQRNSHQGLVSPENRAKFRACTGPAAAYYLDMYTNPEFKADGTRSAWYRPPVGGRRLNALIDRLEDGLFCSDEYIWMFGERNSWADWGKFDYCDRYEDAYTNGTWDAALPGFSAEIAMVKDPIGTLTPRLAALKASGNAVNLAGEPVVKEDGFRYDYAVKGVKYGEWYAVLVEMKSAHPAAGIGLKIGARSIWTRPTASVIFSRPKADGSRRGVAFQRIWGDADTLTVNCSYCSYRKTKPQDVKVSIYRVYSPNGR